MLQRRHQRQSQAIATISSFFVPRWSEADIVPSTDGKFVAFECNDSDAPYYVLAQEART